MNDRKTICLVMIFRNEAAWLYQALESIKGYIDYAIFVDGSSEDDSVHIINTMMGGMGGAKWEVHNFTAPFRFDHKRTYAMDLAKGKADYLLVMDADNTISFDMIPQMAFLELTEDAYYLTKHCGSIRYQVLSLFNGSRDWQYIGLTHECPQLKGGGVWTSSTFPGAVITEPVKDNGPRRKGPEIYYNDALMIERELYDNGATLSQEMIRRYTFYLAQSYRDANMIDRAIDAYTARVKMAGWEEEIFYSLFSIARLKQDRDDPPQMVILAAMEAWQYRPQRKEAAYYLMTLLHAAGFEAIAYVVGKHCQHLACNETLFLEPDVYDIHFPEMFAELHEKYKSV